MGGGRELGGGGVPVVLVAQNLEQLESALAVVDRNGHVNSHGMCVCVSLLNKCVGVCVLSMPNV